MPELPEVEALVQFLDRQTSGTQLSRIELASFSALKTVAPSPQDLLGSRVVHWVRHGKYLCLEMTRACLVVHLSRAGWLKWHLRLPETVARPSRGPLVLRVGFGSGDGAQSGPGFDLTEAGKEKRVSLWVVEDPLLVPAIAALGPDPLNPDFTSQVLAEALAQASGNIKSALTKQSVLAGVGNAYSDEALHVARISPFKAANKLSGDELVSLHQALVDLFAAAIGACTGLGPEDLKDEKRSAMRVHGRTGLPCPICGDTICEVAFATRSLQYCPTCQTGGRRLADRRFSRLLK